MKCSIFAVGILLSGIVTAQPHRHRHAQIHAKRNDATPVVWVTDWVSVVKTIEMTTTIWVSSTGDEPQQTVVSAEAIPTQDAQPGVPIQAPESQPANTEPINPPLATDVALPEKVPEVKIDVPGSAPKAQPNSVPEKDTSDPVTSTADADPAMTTMSDPQATPVSVSEHAATGGQCSSAAPCTGDITYYDPGVGLGACGWKNTKDEPVVALPFGLMGASSNGNSFCGKTITIEHNGKKSTAKVVDKCMGCTGFSIDLSNAVFSELSALSVGRTNAKWWIN